jgi:ABC-type Fe3+/spermidine/putrescine transport system ATPase subunit/ABC-type spermidine/putrescine transport system permease subunit II
MKTDTKFYAQLFLTLITCAFLVIPVCQSVLAGITVNYIAGIKSGLTLKWLIEVWSLYRDTIFRSIGIGLACLGVDLVAGVPAAYVMVKTNNRITRALEEFLVIPLAIPGLAIALALLISYGGFTEFRKSWLIILTGHVIFTLPFMIRSVIAVMASMDIQGLEEGASSLGAGFWRRFFSVIVPNAKTGILAGSLMAFTLSVGEFNLTWMLHTPLTKTLPVGLADSYASMRLEIGSAYTIVFFIMIIPLLMAMQWVATLTQGKKTIREDAPGQDSLTALPKERRPMNPNPNTGTSTDTISTGPSTGTSITLKHCAKTYPGNTMALKPTDLSINPGQTVVILGPSGCGKTTTLRIIAGLESPDAGGSVHFNEKNVTHIPIEKRNVGMVFQNYALFPNMNVTENIGYGLMVRGMEKNGARKRVQEMLAMMQIEDLADRRINQLSGGQRQRVALARAIATRPRVLLLDEPLTALDAKLRDALRVDIDDLLRSVGITAVYVTHDQAEAMALGDCLVIMSRGKIAQTGTPRQIYNHPASEFVARFVGSINTLEGTVQDDAFCTAGTAIPLADLPGLPPKGGEPARFFFRPEHARLTDPGSGRLAARVVSSFFLGDRTKLMVKDPSDQIFNLETPGHLSFTRDDAVGIDLDTASFMTFGD